jgi:hypothetical protein
MITSTTAPTAAPLLPRLRRASSGAVCRCCACRVSRATAAISRRSRALSARHEVLTADLRGRGRSAWDPDPSHYQLPTYLQGRLVAARCAPDGPRRRGGHLARRADGHGLMAAMQPDRIAGVVLNDAGPEFDPAACGASPGMRASCRRCRPGPRRPRKPRASTAWHCRADRCDWLDYAHLGYRENAAGVPVPDMDPKISEAFKNPSTAVADLWPLYAQIKACRCW